MEHWIKLHSKLRNWEWYRNPMMVAFWIHLLLEANWEDSVWRAIPIKRGQIITSIDQLAKNTGLSVRQTRTALDRLTKCGQIVKQTTSQFSIITICNYDRYQSKKEDERQTNDKRNDKRNVTQTTSETTTLIDNSREIEINEDNIENKQKKRFSKPTIEEIKAYCIEKGYKINAEAFFDYYEANGWKVGRNPMKDWKATVRNWARRDGEANSKRQQTAAQSKGMKLMS